MTSTDTKSVLKPGILVNLKTKIEGGVTYIRQDIEHEKKDGSDKTKWETTKIVTDVEEHEAAVKASSLARGKILPLCIASAFGLICPTAREPELIEAIREARKVADAFNETANYTRLSVFAMRGHIASSDEEAARAVASEVASLLAKMEAGVRGADVESIRKAANEAKKLGAVLDESQGKKVSAAVEAARKAAREIVRRVETDGEDVAKVIRDQNMAAVEMARFSFLDIAEEGGRKTERTAVVAEQRSLDTEVAPVAVSGKKNKATVQLELVPEPAKLTKRGRKGRAA